MLAPTGTILVELRGHDCQGYSMWREHDIELLRQATDADGRPFKVITVSPPRQQYLRKKSSLFAPSYLNAYVANGAVIMASFGDPDRDKAAKKIILKSFSARDVIVLEIDHIAELGGGIHCLTQPIPVT